MAIRKWMVVASLALFAVLALTVASIGSAKPEANDPIKVAVVTDIGGLNDKGFNALAAKGLNDAKKRYGVTGRVFISKTAAGLHPEPVHRGTPGVRPRRRERLPHGRRHGGRREAVPGHEVRDHRLPVGCAQGEAEERPRPHLQGGRGRVPRRRRGRDAWRRAQPVSFVGGQAVPAVVAFRRRLQGGRGEDERQDEGPLGLLAGVRRPGEVQGARAERRSRQGSKVVFAAAGGCGLGALQAAKEQGVWGIGVDADQAYLGTHILTSATKKVDLAVFTTAG